MKALLLSLALALQCLASVTLRWDSGVLPDPFYPADPNLYCRIEAGGGTYLAAESPAVLSLPPGLYTFRIFAVNAMTGAESLPLVSAAMILVAVQESVDLITWGVVLEIIEPAEDRKFWRLRLTP